MLGRMTRQQWQTKITGRTMQKVKVAKLPKLPAKKIKWCLNLSQYPELRKKLDEKQKKLKFEAFTKSEARAQLKHLLGVPIPFGTVFTRGF